MKPVLQLKNVTGGYSLKRPVLHGLSINVNPGEMVGLIGLNGAGKSTTIKHILGLLKQHKGEIYINGNTLESSPMHYRSSYAYVPESPLMYYELTVEEHLKLTAMAYDIDKKEYANRVDYLVDEFQMRDKLTKFSAHLSKGMRQKMMIMSAFLVQPSLYIIDEPFLGLDPLGIRSLLDLMVKMKEAGASILMSSHILSTIEQYCDKLVVLHEGHVIASGNLSNIQQASGVDNATLEDAFYALVKDGI
ncbi:ABC transporter ATP-binding protein [Chengkuizengella marina]|uniref:ABC transporter ATP-binding protein n=1 Tax=Chengkuizengella marina TaxID=2507566 RepID=A0A6N9Q2C7_9BACL|nr:ABC transporter ATP-binding protein [Chengkuizengella marina]NBI28830.1 ABC transporter ATP-binding protein [Chengkuizengella marina]